MKKFFIGLLAAFMLVMLASTALGARTFDGRTYDAEDPYCYHNESGDARIYSGATVTGTTPRIHVYDKRLMVSADGVNWYEMSSAQSWQAPSGTINHHYWNGPPALNTGTFLYITQIAARYYGQPINWTNADRSAGKWITCYDR